jgi:predicted nucleic acid-binding protein
MEKDRPLVFLDTNVVLDYLNGQLPWLFDRAFAERFRYAINPVVFQEVVLGIADRKNYRRLERVLQRMDMLPIDINVADAMLPRAKELRNRGLHSNDILIFSSAADCDYLLTSDKSIGGLLTHDRPRPRILTPEQFHEEVETPE